MLSRFHGALYPTLDVVEDDMSLQWAQCIQINTTGCRCHDLQDEFIAKSRIEANNDWLQMKDTII